MGAGFEKKNQPDSWLFCILCTIAVFSGKFPENFRKSGCFFRKKGNFPESFEKFRKITWFLSFFPENFRKSGKIRKSQESLDRKLILNIIHFGLRQAMKKNSLELSVIEASLMLDVSSRSIINYIKAGEIEAIKVGKNWFISHASLIGFKQRYGLGLDKKDPSLEMNKNKEEEPLKESKTSSMDKIDFKKNNYSVSGLRLFQMAKNILSYLETDKDISEINSEAQRKIHNLKMDALELLGSGFYSFDLRNKIVLYNRSREKIGALMALIYFYFDGKNKLSKELSTIENDLLPAYGSLIRKIEKKK